MSQITDHVQRGREFFQRLAPMCRMYNIHGVWSADVVNQQKY